VAIDKKGELSDSILYHQSPERNSMRPEAKGDEEKFRATVDASKSWAPEYFGKWIRSIDSPNPNELTISDDYTLGSNATGVAFIWNTYLACKVEGNKIAVSGEYGSKCEITAPEDCAITLDEFSPGAEALKGMALPLDHKCTRIIIKKAGAANEDGQIQIKVKLIAAAEK